MRVHQDAQYDMEVGLDDISVHGLRKEVPIWAKRILRFDNMDNGAGATQNPPGFKRGICPQHHQRGHLIGNDLGGSGKNPNLVTLTEGTNHPVMYEFEQAVKKYVLSTKAQKPTPKFLYEVCVDYREEDYVGDGVRFGVQGNPYCVFPAPSRLRLYLRNEQGAPMLPEKIPHLSTDGDGGLIVQNGTYKFHYGHGNHTKNNCWAGSRKTTGTVCANCGNARTGLATLFQKWHFCPRCTQRYCEHCGLGFSPPSPFVLTTRLCPNPLCQAQKTAMVLW